MFLVVFGLVINSIGGVDSCPLLWGGAVTTPVEYQKCVYLYRPGIGSAARFSDDVTLKKLYFSEISSNRLINVNYTSGTHIVNVENCEFVDIESSAIGGVMYLNTSSAADFATATITRCTFLRCGTSGSTYGGVFYFNNKVNVELSQCYFHECYSPMAGGAVVIDGSLSGYVKITNCEFASNKQTSAYGYGGGALYVDNASSFTSFVFTGNKMCSNFASGNYKGHDIFENLTSSFSSSGACSSSNSPQIRQKNGTLSFDAGACTCKPPKFVLYPPSEEEEEEEETPANPSTPLDSDSSSRLRTLLPFAFSFCLLLWISFIR